MAADEGAPEAMVADHPDETPEAVAVASVDTEAIQKQLREKEQLVGALTERLEQAAEQLDRIRRTGVDKGRRPLGGGTGTTLPGDLVEDHKHTLEDLKRVITNWEDIQAGATLGRIETQIIELRDLITASLNGGTFPVSTSGSRTATAAAGSTPAAAPARERSAETAAPHSASKASGNAWWEAQKAALMGQPVPAEVQAALAAAETPAAPAPAEPAGKEPPAPESSCNLAEVVIPDLPAAVDLDNITLDDARAAIRERDRIIQQMREPLLLLKASGQIPLNLTSLENLPEPMRARITELETQWQAKFRQIELDLSLERARLAREQAAVHQQHEALQKQLRNGAFAIKAGAGDDGSGRGDENSSSKRRWFRFMGKTQDNAPMPGPKDEAQ